MIGKSIRRCALLFLAGTALQLSVGDIDATVISHPWGVVLALNYLYALIFLTAFSDRWKFVRSLHDRSAEISSLTAMLVMTILFGLVRQDGSTDGPAGMMGFTRMTSSWIFNIFLFYWMTVMGMTAIDDVRHFRRRRKTTVLMHTAFFVIMAAAFFGSGDKIRLKVSAVQGIPVYEGVTSAGKTIQLPFSLTLEDFEMEEYPPKVHLLQNGGLSHDHVTIEKAGDRGVLDGLEIECLEYLGTAGRLPGDSSYVGMKHVGATTALLLKVCDTATGKTGQGWVSCGSHIFEASALQLENAGTLVMPEREPKKYLSSIEVAGKDFKDKFEIRVNSPAEVGGWRIYQSGYDRERGRWSTVSVLDCVKDSWYSAVRIALWVILGTGLWIILSGWKVHKEE